MCVSLCASADVADILTVFAHQRGDYDRFPTGANDKNAKKPLTSSGAAEVSDIRVIS